MARSRSVLAMLVILAISALAAPAQAGQPRWIGKTIQRMTLEEKVGQLFLANVNGESANTTAPADVDANQTMYGPGVRNARDLVDKYKLGGIVYFRWTNNLNRPPQIARLSNGIQRAALRQRARIPMLIATDQEHGVVSRVWAPATEFPGNMTLGATRRNDDAFDAANVTAKELKALGINQNYAPVADVNVNPLNPVIGVRSFGENSGLVSGLTAAAVRGTQKAGESATLKHFPGHGDTVTDSHSGVPWIFHTRQQWDQIDAPPFRAGIAAGADMVMTAHVVMPKLQSDCDETTQQGCDPASQRNLVNALIDTGKPVVLLATRNPYDIASLTRAQTFLATYSWTKPAMGAVARVLFGKLNPRGRLPVRIPSAGDPNATLYPYGFGLGY